MEERDNGFKYYSILILRGQREQWGLSLTLLKEGAGICILRWTVQGGFMLSYYSVVLRTNTVLYSDGELLEAV